MDERLRRLHRAASEGDPDAQLELEMAIFRASNIEHDDLEILAHLGHEPSQARLGWMPTGVRVFLLPSGLKKRAIANVGELRDLLDRWPKHTQLRLALHASREAERVAVAEHRGDYIKRVNDAVQAWLESDNDFSLLRVCDELGRNTAQNMGCLARAVSADLTPGHHDMPPRAEVASYTGSAIQAAARIAGDEVVTAAMIEGVKRWVMDSALAG